MAKQARLSPNQIPPLPGSKVSKKKLVQAEVDVELFETVHRHLKKRNHTMKQAVEWGLDIYVAQCEAADKG